MSQDIILSVKIPKRYYDIAVEIEALPETKIKLNYDGNVEERKQVAEVHESFAGKVDKILKENNITTVKQRKAIQRARTILQLSGGLSKR